MSSRVEQILQAKANGELYIDKPLSRVEEALINLSVGGGGGVDSAITGQVANLARDLSAAKYDISELQRSVGSAASEISNVKEVQSQLVEKSILDSDIENET